MAEKLAIPAPLRPSLAGLLLQLAVVELVASAHLF